MQGMIRIIHNHVTDNEGSGKAGIVSVSATLHIIHWWLPYFVQYVSH